MLRIFDTATQLLTEFPLNVVSVSGKREFRARENTPKGSLEPKSAVSETDVSAGANILTGSTGVVRLRRSKTPAARKPFPDSGEGEGEG